MRKLTSLDSGDVHALVPKRVGHAGCNLRPVRDRGRAVGSGPQTKIGRINNEFQ